MINITPFIIAIITLVTTLIGSVLVPFIRSKTTAQQQDTIKMWVDIAVMAAEQLYQGSKLGQQKKLFVLEFLETRGFHIDIEAIDSLIESAVYELKNND